MVQGADELALCRDRIDAELTALTPRLAAYTREARLRSAWGVARRLDEILRMKPAGDRVVTMPAELGELVLPPMGGALSPGAAAATAASPASR